MNIVEENLSLLKSMPTLTGEAAQLAHRLAETTERLKTLLDQANAQFRVGDRHATFNKQTIESVSKGLYGGRGSVDPSISDENEVMVTFRWQAVYETNLMIPKNELHDLEKFGSDIDIDVHGSEYQSHTFEILDTEVKG